MTLVVVALSRYSLLTKLSLDTEYKTKQSFDALISGFYFNIFHLLDETHFEKVTSFKEFSTAVHCDFI